MKNLLWFLCFLPLLSFSQNLVPNYSFETKGQIACGPNLVGDFNNAYQDWQTPTQGTPDIFSTEIDSACWNYQPNSQYPGPIGLPGSSMPHSGHSFVGFLAYSIAGFNQREYVQVALDQPMVKDESYCIEFWISLNDSREYATDRIGAYFSTTAVGSSNDQVLPYQPQVETNSFQANYSNWVLISDQVTATDNWGYITIGNFHNDNNTGLQANPGATGQPGTYGSYYFLDDVSVTACPSTAAEPLAPTETVQVYPNPAKTEIRFTSVSGQTGKIEIYDCTGNRVHSTELGNHTPVPVENWPRGLYLYKILPDKGLPIGGKFLLD